MLLWKRAGGRCWGVKRCQEEGGSICPTARVHHTGLCISSLSPVLWVTSYTPLLHAFFLSSVCHCIGVSLDHAPFVWLVSIVSLPVFFSSLRLQRKTWFGKKRGRVKGTTESKIRNKSFVTFSDFSLNSEVLLQLFFFFNFPAIVLGHYELLYCKFPRSALWVTDSAQPQAALVTVAAFPLPPPPPAWNHPTRTPFLGLSDVPCTTEWTRFNIPVISAS